MNLQRTITILLADDTDIRNTMEVFLAVQNCLSPICFNQGKPLGALQLQREHYDQVKGQLNSQMTIMAMRLVSGAYTSSQRNYKNRVAAENRRKERCEKKGWKYSPLLIQEPGICLFKRPTALFLVGSRGRDASFRKDGTLSIWTTAGRKRIAYTLPPAFQQMWQEAVEVDSITVIERKDQLLGKVVLTLQIPEPAGIDPVGIDLNETNALVAVDADDHQLFLSGKAHKVKNKRSYQTRKRLQKKLASRKAQKKDTHSLRRLLKRHGRKRSNRTRKFSQKVAKDLCTWASPESVLVLEDLCLPQPEKGLVGGKALRRRMSSWAFGLMRTAIENKAQRLGLRIVFVNPAYTSQNCNRCGLRGKRNRHKFSCPHCGHEAHADVNAARNIRDRFVVFRHDGAESTVPEALS